MKIYTKRPLQKTARKVWDYATKLRHGTEPCKIWKNANCWGCFTIVGNAWGWWVAEFTGTNDIEWITPTNMWAKPHTANQEKSY